MAIIIKCHKCHKKNKTDAACPECGAAEKDYFIDYRPDGRYGDQKRNKLKGVANYEDALEYDRTMKISIRERRNPEIVPDINQLIVTFNDLYEEYLKYCLLHTKESPSKMKSHKGREYRWNYILKKIGELPITHFDKYQIGQYQQKRAADGVANKTINNELYEVSGLLDWCRTEKDFSLEKIHINKLPHKRPIPIILSQGEIVQLIDAAPPWRKAFYLLMYTLGWRFSEAAHLAEADVDFNNKKLHTIQKGGGWKKSVLNPALEKALKAIKPVDDERNINKYYFFIKRTGRPIVDIRRGLAADVEKAKISKHVNPHLLRHSIATHMLQKNVNLQTIKEMLGHADIGTTNWYTHVVIDDIKEATDDMFKKMFKKSQRRKKA